MTTNAKFEIEEGRFYRNRNGEKIGPMKWRKDDESDNYPWFEPSDECYTTDGRYRSDPEHKSEYDLIAPWTESEVPAVDPTESCDTCMTTGASDCYDASGNPKDCPDCNGTGRRRIPAPAKDAIQHTHFVPHVPGTIVDLWQHERGEYWKTIESLKQMNSNQVQIITSLAAGKSAVIKERDAIRSERDELREKLARHEEESRIQGINYRSTVKQLGETNKNIVDHLHSQLAEAKSAYESAHADELAAHKYACQILPKEIADELPISVEQAMGCMARHIVDLKAQFTAMKSAESNIHDMLYEARLVNDGLDNFDAVKAIVKERGNGMKPTKTPTGHAEYVFYCHAPIILKQPWEELTAKAKNECQVNGPIPCGGEFKPGPWCEECRFGKSVEQDYEIRTKDDQ